MPRFGQKKSALSMFAGFGDFVLSHREEVLRSWIAMVDRDPTISASNNLTYTQLLDHLPELCSELAVLLKQPEARDTKREAKRDAQVHGSKRWRQGYELDELIREICLVRRDFIDTWFPRFSDESARFDIDAQNGARRVVESFFDNVIIEATVQFVDEHDQAVRQTNAAVPEAMKRGAAKQVKFIKLVTHRVREPLGPLLFALEVLLHEESLSPHAVEMIQVLQRGVKEEARAIEELLGFIERIAEVRIES
jgi:signal transduction histidine kinase